MSERIPVSEWARPIDTSDMFEMTVKPVATESNKRLFHQTKDSFSPTGHSLRAKVRMTFSGLRTKNRALYLPDEHHKAAITFITPYPKPVQLHHRDEQDPIGRVIDVQYVDTTNSAAMLDSRIIDTMMRFKDKSSSKLKRMSGLGTFLDLSKNARYSGVGHVLGLWEITDPDSIKKFMDGRYLTVSASFLPKGAYCSSCIHDEVLTDWRHDVCDHERGDMIEGYETVAIPYDYEFDECSPVNHPALAPAQVVEVGEHLSFSDATSRVSYSLPKTVFEDYYLVNKAGDQALRMSDSTKVDVPQKLDEEGLSVDLDNLSERINWKDLDLALDLEVGKDAKLSTTVRETLLASAFCGPDRNFPISDHAYVVAARRLINRAKISSADKARILRSVNHKARSLGYDDSQDNVNTALNSRTPEVAVKLSPAIPETRSTIDSSFVEASSESKKAILSVATSTVTPERVPMSSFTVLDVISIPAPSVRTAPPENCENTTASVSTVVIAAVWTHAVSALVAPDWTKTAEPSNSPEASMSVVRSMVSELTPPPVIAQRPFKAAFAPVPALAASRIRTLSVATGSTVSSSPKDDPVPSTVIVRTGSEYAIVAAERSASEVSAASFHERPAATLST